MPNLIFLHGPPASGKLTIAKELSAITGYKLFHNHLVVDTLLSLFDFGTPNFVKHREKLWFDLIGDAVLEGTNIIFTFNPEATVDPSFATNLAKIVAERNGTIDFVEISCPEDEIRIRLESEERKSYKKLSSAALYKDLKDQNAFAYPIISSRVTVDSSTRPPLESAKFIAESLSISTPSLK